MIEVNLTFVSQDADPSKGIPQKRFVTYAIPSLNLEETIEYCLIPRIPETELEERHIKDFIKFGEGHAKPVWTNEKFENISSLNYDKRILGLWLDLLFLPTFYLSDAEKRVAIAHDDLVNFMQLAIDTMAKVAAIESKKTFFEKLFPFVFWKTKKEESTYDVYNLSADIMVTNFQKSSICCRHPKDVFWDCIAPNV